MAKPFAIPFYKSEDWQTCRQAYISKRIKIDGGICEMCGMVPGTEVHHTTFLTPQNINNPDITLNHDRLKLLCSDCHINIHKAAFHRHFEKQTYERNLDSNGIWYDEYGQPHRTEVIIVWGAPASGKTTYVLEHWVQGDMIIDFDLLKRSIVPADKAVSIAGLLDTALLMRELLYRLVEERKVDARHVWITALLPRRKERTELADRLKAQLIQMQASQDECLKRAAADEERNDYDKQRFLIERWFEMYEP